MNATTLKVPEARMELMIENAVMRVTWHIPGRRARLLAGAVLLAAAVGVTAAVSQSSACAATIPEQTGALSAGTHFYLDPHSAVAYWDANNANSPYEPAINARIGAVPAAVWFTTYDPDRITARVSSVTSAATAQGAVPVLVLYAIPEVNCTKNAVGAAPNVADYESWATAFAAGLGGHKVIVIVEPDGLASQTCLNSQEASQRDAAIAFAGRAVHQADAAARVYFDAGNSAWNPASVQAKRLQAADVVGSADGIFSNVSNFRSTADEVAYDKRILADLGNPSSLHIVIDTSRNGNGPGNTWCDPSGRALGHLPTVDTGSSVVDAYLWIKDPGQADGCAASAGAFDPALAYALIANGPGGAGPYAAKTPTAPPSQLSGAASTQPSTAPSSSTTNAGDIASAADTKAGGCGG
ncbi:glycoside hydrolase family 6 protein [Actinospica robiniae]|uniref:glycoside hydrolase family 6 protein n=1 Tax=Actinospica robiniae TaxID=304901 RepID=UPI00146F9B9E|nr:glycoside hydrolase family 6 protein [Actinospica robiniae]